MSAPRVPESNCTLLPISAGFKQSKCWQSVAFPREFPDFPLTAGKTRNYVLIEHNLRNKSTEGNQELCQRIEYLVQRNVDLILS